MLSGWHSSRQWPWTSGIGFAGGRAGPASWLRACMVADGDRMFLWTPVLLATGVAAYFAVGFEPSPMILWALAAVQTGGYVALRQRGLLAPLTAGLLCLALGLAAASLRTHLVAGPVLDKPLAGQLVGRVDAVEETDTGGRIAIIAPRSFAGLPANRLPRRVRVNIRLKDMMIEPGAVVRLRARLMPPPEPVMPGGFDYARQVWFNH